MATNEIIKAAEEFSKMTPEQLDVTKFKVGSYYHNKYQELYMFIQGLGRNKDGKPLLNILVYRFGYYSDKKPLGRIGYAEETYTVSELPISHFHEITKEVYEVETAQLQADYDQEVEKITKGGSVAKKSKFPRLKNWLQKLGIIRCYL